jgi:AbrB family looped-hinge helix DNA binding protein
MRPTIKTLAVRLRPQRRYLTSITGRGNTFFKEMKITIKGQVTIPQALRERFGLFPGTEVEFVPEGDGLRLKAREQDRKELSRFDAWLAKAAGSARPDRSTEEWMAVTRGED